MPHIRRRRWKSMWNMPEFVYIYSVAFLHLERSRHTWPAWAHNKTVKSPSYHSSSSSTSLFLSVFTSPDKKRKVGGKRREPSFTHFSNPSRTTLLALANLESTSNKTWWGFLFFFPIYGQAAKQYKRHERYCGWLWWVFRNKVNLYEQTKTKGEKKPRTVIIVRWRLGTRRPTRSMLETVFDGLLPTLHYTKRKAGSNFSQNFHSRLIDGSFDISIMQAMAPSTIPSLSRQSNGMDNHNKGEAL